MKFLFDIDQTLNDEDLSETFLLASLVAKEHDVIFVTTKVSDDFIRERFFEPYELHTMTNDDVRGPTKWMSDLLRDLADQEITILVNALNLSKHTRVVDASN